MPTSPLFPIHTKFYVVSKAERAAGISQVAGWDIKLSAIWAGAAADGGNACLENRVFGKHTPQGEITLFITNPEAAAAYKVGREYYVDFSVAHPAKEVKYPEAA